jgi:putative addiction module component (TIGR02574 family)
MSLSLEACGIDRLSVAERLELIEAICDTLPADVAPEDVPGWHLKMLAKRLADAEANRGVGEPWREVLDRLRQSRE